MSGVTLTIGNKDFTGQLREGWEIGGRAMLGESDQGTIVVHDESGAFNSSSLSPGEVGKTAVLRETTNNTVLARGRVVIFGTGRPYVADGGTSPDRQVDWHVQIEDANRELKGIDIQTATRPQETDVARVRWVLSTYLNGSPRASTVIADTYVASGNTVTLDAKTYRGTDPYSIIADCANEAGKQFFVTSDDELFYDLNTSTAYAAGISISDRLSELDSAGTGGGVGTMSWSNIPTSAQSPPHWPYCGSVQKMAAVKAATASTVAIVSTHSANGEGPGGAIIPSGVTVSGSDSNRALVVILACNWDGVASQFTSVKYRPNAASGSGASDQSFTQYGSEIHIASAADDSPASKGIAISVWRLVAPSASSGAMQGSLFTDADAGDDVWAMGAYYLTGVDQTTPIEDGADVTASGSTTSSGSATGSLLIDGIAYRTLWSSAAIATAGAGQTNDVTEGNGVETFGIMNTVLQTSHRAVAGNPVLPPIWDGDVPFELNGQQLDHGLRLWYGNDQSVLVTDPSVLDSHDYFIEQVFDDQATTSAGATRRANAYLGVRKIGQRTYNVTVRLSPDQVHLVKYGQTISLKARAVVDADDAPITRRIGQLRWTHPGDDVFMAHMQLDVPTQFLPGSVGAGAGSTSQAAQKAQAIVATAIPFSAAGDMLYYGSNGSNTRLAIGASNTHLTSDGTKPVWSVQTGGASETVYTIAASGSAATLNLANGTWQDVTLTANCTITLSGATAGKGDSMLVILRQDATGSRTVTWPGSVSWAGGSAPVLQTAASAVDLVTLATDDGGTSWFGVHGGGSSVNALNDLTDVTITSVASGDLLRYNGSAWVNATLSSTDYPYHDEVLTDGSSNIVYASGDVVMVTHVPD